MSHVDTLIASMNGKLAEAGLPPIQVVHPQDPVLEGQANAHRQADSVALEYGRRAKMLAVASDHRCVTMEHLLFPLFGHQPTALAELKEHINAIVPPAHPEDFLLTSHTFTRVIQRIRAGLGLPAAVRAEGPNCFSAKLLDRYGVY